MVILLSACSQDSYEVQVCESYKKWIQYRAVARETESELSYSSWIALADDEFDKLKILNSDDRGTNDEFQKWLNNWINSSENSDYYIGEISASSLWVTCEEEIGVDLPDELII